LSELVTHTVRLYGLPQSGKTLVSFPSSTVWTVYTGLTVTPCEALLLSLLHSFTAFSGSALALKLYVPLRPSAVQL